jgi:hypothetical protein
MIGRYVFSYESRCNHCAFCGQPRYWRGKGCWSPFHVKGAASPLPPEQQRAKKAFRAALASGEIVRGPCYAEGPRCSGPVHGHHHDYRKPVDVVWVCARHHRVMDRERRKGTPLELALAKLASAWRASDAA